MNNKYKEVLLEALERLADISNVEGYDEAKQKREAYQLVRDFINNRI